MNSETTLRTFYLFSPTLSEIILQILSLSMRIMRRTNYHYVKKISPFYGKGLIAIDLPKQDTFYDMLKIDILSTSFSSSLASMASAAGFPVASMPLGFASFIGRAFGVQVFVSFEN
jgi:hypothetical protein